MWFLTKKTLEQIKRYIALEFCKQANDVRYNVIHDLVATIGLDDLEKFISTAKSQPNSKRYTTLGKIYYETLLTRRDYHDEQLRMKDDLIRSLQEKKNTGI